MAGKNGFNDEWDSAYNSGVAFFVSKLGQCIEGRPHLLESELDNTGFERLSAMARSPEYLVGWLGFPKGADPTPAELNKAMNGFTVGYDYAKATFNKARKAT